MSIGPFDGEGKIISVPNAPAREYERDSPREKEWADKDHERTLQEENLADVDPRVQQFTISTNDVLKCGDDSCHQPITNAEPFVLLSIPNRGAVFFHMICLGINTDPDNLQDVHWVAHIKRRFIDNLMKDKLYGRRTPDLRM